MKMTVAAVKILMSLLLILHSSRAQNSSDDSIYTSLIMLLSVSPQSLISLLLLGLTVILSSVVYIWVLRYICVGCCQPIPVGTESEALAGIV
ncbi:ras-related protein Rab-38-like [Lates japonicus]